MINKFYKFYKYEHELLIKVLQFYIDVFRCEKKYSDEIERLEKLKKKFEEGLEVK